MTLKDKFIDPILDTTEIKKRSIKGAKWLVLMNVFGMPSAFLIALLLGRTGPSALGTYALVQVLIGVVSTFVVYGGSSVLAVFIPKIKSFEERGKFFASYFLILLGFMTFTLLFFRLYPPAFEFLLRREFDMRDYGWFVLLSALIVTTEILANTASGLMLIKVTAIARQIKRLVLLPVVGLLYVFKPHLLLEHGMAIVTGGFMAGYVLACLICVQGIRNDKRFKIQAGFYLPSGFWSFSLAAMVGTVFTFLYGNFDRMAVLSILDLTGLGIYQAVISINHLTDLIPQLIGTTLVPMFSSLLATDDKKTIVKTYDILQTAFTFMIMPTGLLLISFSNNILNLFGDEYSPYSLLLIMFCVASSMQSLSYVNFTLLTSYEKNRLRLTISTIQILIQIIGTLLFIRAYGVFGIAVSKMAGRMVAQVISIVYIKRRLVKDITVPRAFIAGVSITLITAVARHCMHSTDVYYALALFVASLVVLFILSGVKHSFFVMIFKHCCSQ